MIKPILLGAATLLTVASVAPGQQSPATRQLGPIVATSSETFGEMIWVRHLKNGVLVNDVRNRRLLLFDSTLTHVTVVADSTPATANAYSGRSAGLIAYRGDSTLFVDPQSLSMQVIDPSGKFTRTMAVPRSQDAMVLGNTMFGTPAFDASGRLVYRGFPRPQFAMRAERGGGGGAGGPAFSPAEIPDSTAVMRVDLATRQVDTVAYVKIPKVKMDVQRDDNGRVRVNAQMNPLPVIDDWAVLSDGSIALVRGRDYHIDWIRPDGSRISSPKMPFDWQRMTDEDKVAFLDSLKAARQRMVANAPAPATPGAGAGAGGGGGAGAGGGGERVVIMGGPGGAGGPAGAAGGMGREMNFVSASELPDYKPPFFAGAVRADDDGFLWIRTIPTKGTTGGPVYDVINAKGELVERVQLPNDRTIVGFGRGGVVYLLAREAIPGSTPKLEKARIR
jgi:hypothetical protein